MEKIFYFILILYFKRKGISSTKIIFLNLITRPPRTSTRLVKMVSLAPCPQFCKFVLLLGQVAEFRAHTLKDDLLWRILLLYFRQHVESRKLLN
jgi:hypothetical protein